MFTFNVGGYITFDQDHRGPHLTVLTEVKPPLDIKRHTKTNLSLITGASYVARKFLTIVSQIIL